MTSAMTYVGDVELPDDRGIVHGKIVTDWEWDTNAGNILSVYIEWKDGDELTVAEYNMDLGGCYLHEYVTDELCKQPPEPEDDEP